jgi:2,4-dienoyl-CoA reductase-like NADH-dependent reductase (Old Yellow Enzyme family)
MTKALFEPFTLKSLELKNRIAMAPMTRSMSPNGIPGRDVAAYYRARAKGGTGLIITEGTTINRLAASNNANIPNFHAPGAIAGWSRVVNEVHEAGAKIAPQLWHQGASRTPGTGPNPTEPSEGPSTIEGVAQAMTDSDIADTIEAFIAAAGTAKEIGFDAIELHGAHGYLIDQYLWAQTNRRSDRYGGDITDCTKFGADIIRGVRERVGPDFPIIMRFSQFKLKDYAARLAETPDELETLLAPYVDAGVDILHASSRRFWEPEFEGSPLNLAGWAKRLTGLPVISVGSVGLKGADVGDLLKGDVSAPQVAELDQLEERVARGEFDIVAVGRALLTDPEWANKIRDGRTSELKGFDRASLLSLVGAENPSPTLAA